MVNAIKKIGLVLAIVFSYTAAWCATDSTSLQKAEVIASKEHKYILLNFSGSDWCIPCIKMKKQIFATDAFQQFASSKLVWINADFPRSRKNLSKEKIAENEALANQYNSKGVFPYTLLLNQDGKVIKTWDGFQNVNAADFIKQVEADIIDNK